MNKVIFVLICFIMFYHAQQELRKGNVFTSMCQDLCPWGGVAWQDRWPWQQTLCMLMQCNVHTQQFVLSLNLYCRWIQTNITYLHLVQVLAVEMCPTLFSGSTKFHTGKKQTCKIYEYINVNVTLIHKLICMC